MRMDLCQHAQLASSRTLNHGDCFSIDWLHVCLLFIVSPFEMFNEISGTVSNKAGFVGLCESLIDATTKSTMCKY